MFTVQLFKLLINDEWNRTENRPNNKEHRVRLWNKTVEAKYREVFQTQTIHEVMSMLDNDHVDINEISDEMEAFLLHSQKYSQTTLQHLSLV